MRALLDIVQIVLNLYIWVIFIQIILSWLLHFGVLNRNNRAVMTVWQIADRLTDPALRRLRRVIPAPGGLDLAPMALVLLLILTERIIVYYVYPNVF